MFKGQFNGTWGMDGWEELWMDTRLTWGVVPMFKGKEQLSQVC
jgi:hypothetical protein